MGLEDKYISISEAAKMLNVTIQTLRRWDDSGKLTAVRTKGNQRRYSLELIKSLLEKDIFRDAKFWAMKGKSEPLEIFYCTTRAVFEARNNVMEKLLKTSIGDAYSIISTSSGEMGNNSFDHNLGNWPDIMGIYFGYNIEQRRIVLADRGLGILKTLQHVIPDLPDHQEALRIAFTEMVSGRAPEKRGNGLKYVRRNVENGYFNLTFQTGDAELILHAGKSFSQVNIKKAKEHISGCLAQIEY